MSDFDYIQIKKYFRGLLKGFAKSKFYQFCIIFVDHQFFITFHDFQFLRSLCPVSVLFYFICFYINKDDNIRLV